MKYEATKFIPFQLLYEKKVKLPIELKIVSFQKPDITYEEALKERIDIIINKMYKIKVPPETISEIRN